MGEPGTRVLGEPGPTQDTFRDLSKSRQSSSCSPAEPMPMLVFPALTALRRPICFSKVCFTCTWSGQQMHQESPSAADPFVPLPRMAA